MVVIVKIIRGDNDHEENDKKEMWKKAKEALRSFRFEMVADRFIVYERKAETR